MSYLYSKRYCGHLQLSFKQLSWLCRHLYQFYAPKKFKYRRNVKQEKISDPLLLTLLVWQAMLGIQSQRRFSQLFINLSHSRFNRRARQLLPIINLIRRKLNQQVACRQEPLIVDSLPMRVCHPIRNHRVKIFQGTANIGYNSTKKVYYYGFKGHFIVNTSGYIFDYIVTKASVHDAQAAGSLILNAHLQDPYILGDLCYLGKQLHQRLLHDGYYLWTPYRKNMTGAKQHNSRCLAAIRRTIESDFALLKGYGVENNRARTLVGFQQRLEIAILTYNLGYLVNLNN